MGQPYNLCGDNNIIRTFTNICKTDVSTTLAQYVKIVNEEDELLLTIETNADMTLEFGLFDRYATFFEEVYNIKPVIRQKKSNNQISLWHILQYLQEFHVRHGTTL